MCGFTGFFQPGGFRAEEAEPVVVSMRDRLFHRGPDDAGIWMDGEAGVALGHRRLSIIDLSSHGHQPMVSVSGRYVMVYNGEVYNYRELRQELDSDIGKSAVGSGQGDVLNSVCEVLGHGMAVDNRTSAMRGERSSIRWRGTSDTEVLLAGIEKWGLESTLKKCVGMFSLALWDRQERVVSLARDRMGEKPLYYGWQRGVLLFGSELKALKAHSAFEAVIDRNVLPLYLRHGYIPAPWCIWRGIRKLLPGTWVALRAQDRGKEVEPMPFWSFYQTALLGQTDPFTGSDQEAINELEAILKRAVAGQMLADVPIGAFLSGGVDSSTVVALMQAQSNQRVKTFTVGFAEDGYDEAFHAKAVAAHLRTDHTELYITADQAQDVIPKLPKIFDEPLGDSSGIPTYLVSQLARQRVTASLSGDGGDELFGGYERYFKVALFSNLINRIPRHLQSFGQKILSHKIVWCAKKMTDYLCFGQQPLGLSFAAKLELVSNMLNTKSLHQRYQAFTTVWHQNNFNFQEASLTYGLSEYQQAKFKQPFEQMMAQDSLTYLPDDILVKIDRATMAVGLESRLPLLDHRVVELAWRIPYGLKVRGGQAKWLLRQVLNKYVPRHLINRPKMGFGAPVDRWLRGSLRDWGEEFFSKKNLEQGGIPNAKGVRERWNEHQKGKNNWRDSLWLVIMWQAWLKNQLS